MLDTNPLASNDVEPMNTVSGGENSDDGRIVDEQENSEETPEYIQAEVNPAEEKFAAGAFGRIVKTMIVATVILPIATYFRFGRAAALSLLAGCVVSLFNFGALRKIVAGIAEQTFTAKRARRNVILRFLLRYALVGAAFYVIFRGSAANLYGLMVGLSFPVLATFVEAGYEVVHAFRSR